MVQRSSPPSTRFSAKVNSIEMICEQEVHIVALGSPHGDDQVAWRVAERLALDSTSIRVVPLTTPWDLLEHLLQERRIIVLDACCTGAAPGTVFRINGLQLDHLPGDRFSTHGGSVAEIIKLATALGRRPQALVILAVEITSANPTSEISERGHLAITELERQVRRELSQWEPRGAAKA